MKDGVKLFMNFSKTENPLVPFSKENPLISNKINIMDITDSDDNSIVKSFDDEDFNFTYKKIESIINSHFKNCIDMIFKDPVLDEN